MFDPMIVMLAKDEYNERLARAAQSRRMSRATSTGEGVVDGLLLGLSELLIHSGEALKQRVDLQPRTN